MVKKKAGEAPAVRLLRSRPPPKVTQPSSTAMGPPAASLAPEQSNAMRPPRGPAAGPSRKLRGQGKPLQEVNVGNRTQLSVSTVSSRGTSGLSTNQKKAIWDFLEDLIEEVQVADPRGQRAAFKKFQNEFYKECSVQLTNEYQKYFAQSLWRISILPFSHPNSPPVEHTLKFLFKVYSTVGTAEDKEEMGFTQDTYPMYFYVLKLFNQSHMDTRQLVRLRVMEVANAILKKHHSASVLAGHRTILKDVVLSLGIRLRDKYAPVRVLSATMLRYFGEDNSVIKDLKYYARYDPSSDSRRAAIASLREIPSTKVSFFYEHAFDPSDIVRIEALTGLGTRPMINLTMEKREKVLFWGLTQEARVKKCVTEKLLPAWFEECQSNPLEFLKRLDLSNNTRVAFMVLQNLYGDNFSDTFDKIDRSFLNERNLIPVEKMSLESVIFWMFLVKKFGNIRFNAERLIPTADQMGPYIKAIIESIHTENRNAQDEDREEDVTLLLCLRYILLLTVSVGLEEGTRRVFEDILKQILLDPILDEAPLIKTSVDIMKKIVEPHIYAEKMMLIFQEVFEPSDPTVIEGTPHKSRSQSREQSRKSEQDPEEMELETTIVEEQEAEATPSPVALTDQERFELKDQICNLAVQRLRLGEEKATAIRNSNYLEAHRLQEIIDAFLKEETEKRAQMMTPHTSLLFAEASGSRSKSLSHNKVASGVGGTASNSKNPMMLDSAVGRSRRASSSNRTVSETDISQIPASQCTADNQVVISEQNILKGLVMLTRFLSLHPKLTPFVRQLYENHIVFCLTEEDARVRTYTLHLLCMIALIEEDEKRKIMALMLRALEADTDPMVKSAAFKGTVDLLLKYKIERFRPKESGDFVYDELPGPYNDPNASKGELEEMFVIVLDKYADEQYGLKTPEAVADKVMGMIKLLQISRIVSESIVSELLCMWSDKQYRGSAVPFHIGMWIPTYTKLSLSNAKLVGKALLLSVTRILNAADDPTDALCESDFMKLVELVTPTLSRGHIDAEDGEKVHEELALMILNEVLKHPKRTANVSMVKITAKLYIQTEQTAKEICDVVLQILLKIASFPQTATVSTLKVALRAAQKRLKKRFEDLDDLPDPRKNSGSDNSDVDLENQAPFSEDEKEEERSSYISNVSAVPQINKSDEEESETDDNIEGGPAPVSESGDVEEDSD